MGIYLNPGNRGFRTILNGDYVDKTGLVDYVNRTIDTPRRFTCFSRPRRFGKSFAAKMLCAYYDRDCDSRSLFEGLEASKTKSYEKHLNKYDVVYLDITWFISTTDDVGGVVDDLQGSVIAELRNAFGDSFPEGERSLPRALSAIAAETGHRFVVIIDEWDALFREAKDDEAVQKEYVQFLRGLFKGGPATDETIAAAYMTGILPIKKYGTESALTDFQEFTMVDPLGMSEYIGFTERDVLRLCEQHNVDFDEIKQWYDGYRFEDAGSVYNPNSVMKAVEYRRIRNYWTQTETYESLKNYISMNFDGLRDSILAMLGGEFVKVAISTFQNDITSFKNKDDVLTLLIHLGYLGYDSESQKAFIPNQEVADAFADAVRGDGWEVVGGLIRESEDLLEATIRGDAEAVAGALEEVHNLNSSVLQYNNEASLRSAIMIAYYTARRAYKIVPEFPQGKGFVDLAFLPRKGTDKPAMVVELKCDKDADTAIRQIREKRYGGDLKEYFGNLLLVGINYDKDAKGPDAKRHSCIIEKA